MLFKNNSNMIKGNFQLVEDIIKNFYEDQGPFSFIFDGDDSEDLICDWEKTITSSKTDQITLHEIKYSDSKTGLICRIEIKTYEKTPAIDWVIFFENKTDNATPILENILPMEWMWGSNSKIPARLFYSKGSNHKIDDFQPIDHEITPSELFKIGGENGRPSTNVLPFMNLHCRNQGVFISIGWTGQWFTSFFKQYHGNFHHDQSNNFCEQEIIIEAGMENTHLKLLPGEIIRTPRIMLFFWEGEKINAHNAYRHFIADHYSPKLLINKKEFGAPICYPMWGSVPIEEHKQRLELIKKYNLDFDYYWVDAGWYIDEKETDYAEEYGKWAEYVGRWLPNKNLYPNGMEELGLAVKNIGLKFLLWFEPERARKGTDLPKQHPEWFLKRSEGGVNLLFNLGNEEARKWLTDFITNMIRDCNIGCYRQDFNFEPIPYWQKSDSPDRRGISEIKHVMGLYQYWDDLLAQFPDLLIDNCSSGGRRFDLETMSRSIPLWRSDYQCFESFDPIGNQLEILSLMHWLPHHTAGTRVRTGDIYNVRSAYSPGLVFHHIVNWTEFKEEEYPWDWYKGLLDEFKMVRPFFGGDFYHLTDLSISRYEWCVFQLHRPLEDDGVIIAFRRDESPYITAALPLKGLDPEKRYNFRYSEIDSKRLDPSDLISMEKLSLLGKSLLNDGFEIRINSKRESEIIFYSSGKK